jgi:hypothetical protein
MKSFIKTYWVYIFFFVICVAFMFAEMKNGRFWLSDFSVYYTAAERIISGINLYRHPEDLHYIFKYSPTSATYFIPFLILPLAAAKVTYWIFLSLVIVFGFYMVSILLKDYSPNTGGNTAKLNRVIFYGGILLALHYMRELHLGQVNYLLMISFIGLLLLYVKNKKPWLIALIWAAGIFIKPFGFILLPYFILKKRYAEVLYFFGFLLVFALLPLAFYHNWELFIGQYKSWIYELNVEMAAKSDVFLERNHTVFSVVARYLFLAPILASSLAVTIYKLIMLGGICLAFLWFILKGEKIKNAALLEFSILFATIPLLAFTTENAFCFTGLLIFITLFYFKQFNLGFKILLILSLLFIGANFSEIVGKQASAVLDNWSIIGIGAIGLIVCAFNLRRRLIG